MKNKRFLIIILVIMVILLITLTTFYITNKDEKVEDEKHGTPGIYLKKSKKEVIVDNNLDRETYSDNIITNAVKSIDYKDYKISINDDEFLCINDKVIDEEIKVKTIYDKAIKTYDDELIFIISNDNKLYAISIQNLILSEMSTANKVLNFVDLKYQGDDTDTNKYAFILEDDGNIYEIFSGMRYNKNAKTLFGELLVYDDNTISNMNGFMFTDKNNNYYKIKYAFMTIKDNQEYLIAIITDDDRYIFSYIKEYSMNVYEAPAKVKNIDYDNTTNNLKIRLDNGDTVKLNGYCDKNFCIDEK